MGRPQLTSPTLGLRLYVPVFPDAVFPHEAFQVDFQQYPPVSETPLCLLFQGDSNVHEVTEDFHFFVQEAGTLGRWRFQDLVQRFSEQVRCDRSG